MTAVDLRNAEVAYRLAAADAEKARLERNRVVRQALQEGWTHADIARATGLTRGRVGQIAMQNQ
jgi:hypothetical protein